MAKIIPINGVRVEVDSRDASKDRLVPPHEAKARYDAGDLIWDCTNEMYAVPVQGEVPEWLANYPKRG